MKIKRKVVAQQVLAREIDAMYADADDGRLSGRRSGRARHYVDGRRPRREVALIALVAHAAAPIPCPVSRKPPWHARRRATA